MRDLVDKADAWDAVAKAHDVYAAAREEYRKKISEQAARIEALEGQHKGLVLQNALLRQRYDLPVDRIPAARGVEALCAENERLREFVRFVDRWANYKPNKTEKPTSPEDCLRIIAPMAADFARAALECETPGQNRKSSEELSRAALEEKA